MIDKKFIITPVCTSISCHADYLSIFWNLLSNKHVKIWNFFFCFTYFQWSNLRWKRRHFCVTKREVIRSFGNRDKGFIYKRHANHHVDHDDKHHVWSFHTRSLYFTLSRIIQICLKIKLKFYKLPQTKTNVSL